MFVGPLKENYRSSILGEEGQGCSIAALGVYDSSAV